MSELDYREIAQKLLDLEADCATEGWYDPEAIDLAGELHKTHGPFELNLYGWRFSDRYGYPCIPEWYDE